MVPDAVGEGRRSSVIGHRSTDDRRLTTDDLPTDA
jgi:hypothetical protein